MNQKRSACYYLRCFNEDPAPASCAPVSRLRQLFRKVISGNGKCSWCIGREEREKKSQMRGSDSGSSILSCISRCNEVQTKSWIRMGSLGLFFVVVKDLVHPKAIQEVKTALFRGMFL